MTFTEHLGEFRSRIIKVLSILGVLFFLCFWQSDPIFEVLTRPLPPEVEKQFISLTGGMFSTFKAAAYVGVLLGFPLVLYQILMFILPALKPKEKRVIFGAFAFSITATWGAVAFVHFLLLPKAVEVFLSFAPEGWKANLDLSAYLKVIFAIYLSFAAVFHLPIFLVALIRIGIFTLGGLRAQRKYVIVILFALAAIITPTTDPFSLMMMAIPMCLLFEGTIWFCTLWERKKGKELRENEEEDDKK